MVKYYVLGAILAAVLGWMAPYLVVQVLLFWTALSLGAVSSAYLLKYPGLFRKREDGSIPVYVRWVFIPFLLGTDAYNSWARKNDEVPAIQQIDEHLFLACRLFQKDIDTLKENGVTAILDVTAEFDGLDWSAYQADVAYLNIPVLDHTSPSSEQLNTAISWLDQQIRKGNKVVVHCALGRGRSVLTLAAYLLARDNTLSVRDAVNQIQSVRSTARLNKRQLRSLIKVKQDGKLNIVKSLALIANPVAGGGKWNEEKEDILAQLNPHFRVTVHETTKEISATVLARQAIESGAQIIVACGGDGTITAVAHACVETGAVLGVIPLGTANALSQVLHGYMTQLLPIETACDVIVEGHVEDIDTANCNDMMMLLVSAVGFEEYMISNADREEKDTGGKFAYLRGLWEAIGQNKTLHLKVRFDEEEPVTLTTPSLVIANAAPIFTALAQGGDPPDITDGKLDITWLEPQDTADRQLLSLAELVFLNTEKKKESERVRHRQVSRIEIHMSEEREFALDGEIHRSDVLTITINPKSLKVLTAPSKFQEE